MPEDTKRLSGKVPAKLLRDVREKCVEKRVKANIIMELALRQFLVENK